jgi:hypothetical protein
VYRVDPLAHLLDLFCPSYPIELYLFLRILGLVELTSLLPHQVALLKVLSKRAHVSQIDNAQLM